MDLKFDTKEIALASRDYFIKYLALGKWTKAEQLEIVDQLIEASQKFEFEIPELDDTHNGGNAMPKLNDVDYNDFTDKIATVFKGVKDHEKELSVAQETIKTKDGEIVTLTEANEELTKKVTASQNTINEMTETAEKATAAHEVTVTELNEVKEGIRISKRNLKLSEAGVDTDKLTDGQKKLVKTMTDEDFGEWSAVFASVKKEVPAVGDGEPAKAKDDLAEASDDADIVKKADADSESDESDDSDNDNLSVGSFINAFAKHKGLVRK